MATGAPSETVRSSVRNLSCKDALRSLMNCVKYSETNCTSEKLAPYSTGLTDDSLQLTFLQSSKSRDTRTRINIKNPADLDTVP